MLEDFCGEKRDFGRSEISCEGKMLVFALVCRHPGGVCVCLCLRASLCVFEHTSHLFDLSHPSCASPLNSNISDILCVIYKSAAAAEEEESQSHLIPHVIFQQDALMYVMNIHASLIIHEGYSGSAHTSGRVQSGGLIIRTSRDTSHMSPPARDTNRAGSETLN